MAKGLTTERDGSPSSSRSVAVWSAIVTVIVLPLTVCAVALIGIWRNVINTPEIITALAVFATPLVGLSVGALFSKSKGGGEPPTGG
jgi:hypothetical protein